MSIIVANLLGASLAMAADARDSYVGAYGLIGVARTNNLQQLPTTTYEFINDSSDNNGLTGGAGIWAGYDLQPRFNVPFSVELAGSYRHRHDENITFTDAGLTYAEKADVRTTDIMASALWHLPDVWSVKPYVGGGAGAVFIQSDTFEQSPSTVPGTGDDRTNFAWQLQAGLLYPLNERFDMRLDYRYIDMGRVSMGAFPTLDTFEYDLASHDIRIGFDYKF
ncbi:MAG: porin family protein [Rickettsiales bacterium]|nr:porin family protein [Rickettsiales bacterium]